MEWNECAADSITVAAFILFTALTDEIASPPTSDDFTKEMTRLSVTYTKAPFIANIAASSIPADSLAGLIPTVSSIAVDSREGDAKTAPSNVL